MSQAGIRIMLNIKEKEPKNGFKMNEHHFFLFLE